MLTRCPRELSVEELGREELGRVAQREDEVCWT